MGVFPGAIDEELTLAVALGLLADFVLEPHAPNAITATPIEIQKRTSFNNDASTFPPLNRSRSDSVVGLGRVSCHDSKGQLARPVVSPHGLGC